MIGDRRHATVRPVPRATHYPERSATADALAESLRAAYSYAQHAASWVGGTIAPDNTDRTEFGRIGGPGVTAYRVLTCDTVIPQHWDRIRATCWFAPLGLPNTDPVTLRLSCDGQTGDGTISSDVEPSALINGLSVYRIDSVLDLSSVTRDSELELTASLLRSTLTFVVPLSCSAWAQVGD